MQRAHWPQVGDSYQSSDCVTDCYPVASRPSRGWMSRSNVADSWSTISSKDLKIRFATNSDDLSPYHRLSTGVAIQSAGWSGLEFNISSDNKYILRTRFGMRPTPSPFSTSPNEYSPGGRTTGLRC